MLCSAGCHGHRELLTNSPLYKPHPHKSEKALSIEQDPPVLRESSSKGSDIYDSEVTSYSIDDINAKTKQKNVSENVSISML